MSLKSEIINRDYAGQIKDYIGLGCNNIIPTDIDGFIDYHNRLFIYFELKYGDSEPKRGQELAFERLVDATEAGGVPSFFLIAEHNCEMEDDIIAAEAIVRRYRHKGQWHSVQEVVTMREFVFRLLTKGRAIVNGECMILEGANGN